jgi:hypothetical protein
MADDAPFLVPVVIDETSDAAARVPDRFREVQWMRLSVKDTPATLAVRVGKLLDRSVSQGGSRKASVGGTKTLARSATKQGPMWKAAAASTREAGGGRLGDAGDVERHSGKPRGGGRAAAEGDGACAVTGDPRWPTQHGTVATGDLRTAPGRHRSVSPRPKRGRGARHGRSDLCAFYRTQSQGTAQSRLSPRARHRRAHAPQGPTLRDNLM